MRECVRVCDCVYRRVYIGVRIEIVGRRIGDYRKTDEYFNIGIK